MPADSSFDPSSLAEPISPSDAAAAATEPFLSLKSGATEVYLIRHADALPGADEVSIGSYDDQALSELGRRQARALAERLHDAGLAAIYASPIGRAYQTAEAVAEACGLGVRIEPGLREVALGHIGPSGEVQLSAEEFAAALRQRLREIAVVAMTSGRWSDIPGSEPSGALRARVCEAVDRLAAAHPGQRLALVSHGGSINAFFAAVLNLERDYFFPAANTSISVARVRGSRRDLLALNDVGHLRDAKLLGFDPGS